MDQRIVQVITIEKAGTWLIVNNRYKRDFLSENLVDDVLGVIKKNLATATVDTKDWEIIEDASESSDESGEISSSGIKDGSDSEE